MLLRNRLARDGALLFRWRSFLPLALLPLLVALSHHAVHAEKALSSHAQQVLSVGGFSIAAAGLLLRVLTVGFVPTGTSGRNTKKQVAEQLNITGVYSVVRNPLYLANFLGLLGFAVFTKVWWFVLLAALAYWLYIERIIAAEEDFLLAKFGERYTAWAENTPAFLPSFAPWRPPALPFSLRTVLRREYNGLALLALGFVLWSFALDVGMEQRSLREWARSDWPLMLCAGFAVPVALLLRTLKHHSDLLSVQGR